MELRPRKRIAKPPIEGSVEERSDSSDDYVLPSESDSSISSDEDETYGERQVTVVNRKGKAKTNDNDRSGSALIPIASTAGPSEINVEEGELNDQQQSSDVKRRKKKYTKGKKTRREMLLWEIWEEEQERWLDQHKTDDVDLDQESDVIVETADAPAELIMPLLRYQKEWLAWALKQEDSETGGGILADEMGMGKTIQAIALVLAKRVTCPEISIPDVRSPSPRSSRDLLELQGTLVICPVVAVTQWVSEIERFTSRGSTKVLVYHGANRGKSSRQFTDYDFVITTYSIVENEYRKYMMPPKDRCPYCGNQYQRKRLSFHLRYFCGPTAIRTLNQSKQMKKKVKVSSTWSKQDAESGKGNANGYEVNKGKKTGKKTSEQLEEEKEALVELGNSADDESSLSRGKSVLHSMKWNRIILDEAHSIKDRRSNTARAVLALESSYKWALSGTPLQNRVGELYSLIRFLRITPYSYYFCKDCDCRILDYSSSTACSNCPHNCVRHFCWWNKYVATPIQLYGNLDTGRRAMTLLKEKILKNVVLRRTKKGRAADLALPPRIISLRQDTLDIKEADYYESLYNESQTQFNTYVEAGTVMNNYAHIFDLLTRLRQAVDHPYLVEYSSSAAVKSGNTVDISNGEQVCGICHDQAEDPVVTSCAHVFCKACLIDFSAALGQVSCPSCSKLLTVDLTTKMDVGDQTMKTTIKGFKRSSILNRIRLNDFQTSTKIEALREEIRFMVERDGSAKGIVFSQFTSFLDLINYSLHKSGINCVQLVGSMSIPARDAAIKRFTEDPDCKIFLMSLKAGGIALNLTVASHVFLMDPWWNPAVEQQAQDRIHRIGQYKPIRVVRFVIENTVEERILKLQEKKELVFEGTVGGSTEALGKLTEADMRFLFIT